MGQMKGIILAGGSDTKLYPMTLITCKQLLPVYDKPLIYYPLTTLMLAGIRDILIISTPDDTPKLKKLLGDGSQFGINLSYAVQEHPDGLAQAFIIGEDFIGSDSVAMILGDNIFYGNGLGYMLRQAGKVRDGATIFSIYVDKPKNYGVVELDENNNPVAIIEKPEHTVSSYAVTGIYFYDNKVVEYAKALKPSARGKLEITDINQRYLEEGRLNIRFMNRGFSWFEADDEANILKATKYIQTIEKLQGIQVSVPEEIAYNMRWITPEELLKSAERYGKSPYGQHLKKVADGKILYSSTKPGERPLWGTEDESLKQKD